MIIKAANARNEELVKTVPTQDRLYTAADRYALVVMLTGMLHFSLASPCL